MFCPHCGKEVFDDAIACIGCGRAVTPLKPLPTNIEIGAQKLREVARAFLFIGILNILGGILAAAIGWLLGIFSIILGIWELRNAYLFWSTPPKSKRNITYIAILEIINVICGPVWSLFVGIANLKRLKSPEVNAYLESLQIYQSRGMMLLVFGWILAVASGVFLIASPFAYFFPSPDDIRKSTQMALGGMVTGIILFGLLLLLAVWIIRKAIELRRLTRRSS